MQTFELVEGAGAGRDGQRSRKEIGDEGRSRSRSRSSSGSRSRSRSRDRSKTRKERR
jgi:hypothetical protein